MLQQEGLLKGKTLGVDATTLEANATMESIVRNADVKCKGLQRLPFIPENRGS